LAPTAAINQPKHPTKNLLVKNFIALSIIKILSTIKMLEENKHAYGNLRD